MCVLCVSLQGDYKFINCMVNATQFHVGLSKVKKKDFLVFFLFRLSIPQLSYRDANTYT